MRHGPPVPSCSIVLSLFKPFRIEGMEVLKCSITSRKWGSRSVLCRWRAHRIIEGIDKYIQLRQCARLSKVIWWWKIHIPPPKMVVSIIKRDHKGSKPLFYHRQGMLYHRQERWKVTQEPDWDSESVLPFPNMVTMRLFISPSPTSLGVRCLKVDFGFG